MRFLAIENFFFGGVLFEATPQTPKIFDFPDDEVPNIKWRPLDAKARKALVDLATKTAAGDKGDGTGNIIRIYDIPEEFRGAVLEGEKIKKEEKTNPDILPAETVAALIPKGKTEVVPKPSKGPRISDQEPD